MNISYRWLQSIAPTITSPPGELAERLGMLGAPVDELIELGAEIGDITIARVESVRPHPNADRLRICAVDAGGEERLQVVCGAPNVEAGGMYPFAPVGARLPGGVQIRKAKLRGEVSEGMLCSARELGLGRDHTGLMALHGEFQPGTPFVEQLGLDDARLVVDVTPNRPDLLSHVGVARELAPGGVADVRLAPFSPGAPELTLDGAGNEGAVAGVRVRIEDAEGCPRYAAAVVRGVRVGPSPEWLATRLRAAGLRPINNVVDATNYVLHELGQPVHAFDLARLAGPEIRVRRAVAGEAIRTLDGVERELGGDSLVIADAERPVALAGVMGGEESEVTEETRDVFIECALFDPRLVRKTARGLGLSTDASYRFERGVDPALQPAALRRVVDLIVATADGAAEQVALDLRPRGFAPAEISLRPARVARVLGVDVDGAEIAALLAPIGFVSREDGDVLRVTVPGWRPDVTREVDLIEEVARRRGYDSFPEELLAYRPSRAREDPFVPVLRRAREVLTRWGFLEARTAAFASAAPERVPLLNPLSAEESQLRASLLPGLLRRVEHNWSHGTRDVRLFEAGTVFAPGEAGALPSEEIRLAAVFTGASRPTHWSGASPVWDLWDLEALLKETVDALGLGAVVPAGGGAAGGVLDDRQRYHVVSTEGGVAGQGGRVRADAVDAPAWAEPVFAVELVLPGRLEVPQPVYRPLPEFPAVERDLALLVPDGTEAAQVDAVLRAAGGDLLERAWPFDLYAGKGVPEGTRSLAWRLRFRHSERTLTDEEVDRAVDAVLRALGEELDVQRR
ncbi:MAG TPA: phenylalanine--tRNA ligase subunit beta [Longimicrobiaceae bacterium]|nr:phenylalanine--tRNA ligase subunit beta [Longimicrobiaceae bacterium]